jgi:hypothetical protein
MRSTSISAASTSTQPASEELPTRNREAPQLCELLERVGAGDKLAVTTTGIYVIEYEREVFYDPSHSLCRLDVAPDTDAQLEASARIDERLQKVFDEDHRAYLTVKGILWGPPAVNADDPSLPEIVAYSHRLFGGYGHQAGSRTLLVISDVLAWRRVPPDAPSLGETAQLRPVSTVPEVVAAAVPGYPGRALFGKITGTVVVMVTVMNGKVTETRIVSGDRELAPSVVENITTWHFKEQVNTTFVTTFAFNLELRETGSDKNPRIELHLPLSVNITGPLNAWYESP